MIRNSIQHSITIKLECRSACGRTFGNELRHPQPRPLEFVVSLKSNVLFSGKETKNVIVSLVQAVVFRWFSLAQRTLQSRCCSFAFHCHLALNKLQILFLSSYSNCVRWQMCEQNSKIHCIDLCVRVCCVCPTNKKLSHSISEKTRVCILRLRKNLLSNKIRIKTRITLPKRKRCFLGQLFLNKQNVCTNICSQTNEKKIPHQKGIDHVVLSLPLFLSLATLIALSLHLIVSLASKTSFVFFTRAKKRHIAKFNFETGFDFVLLILFSFSSFFSLLKFKFMLFFALASLSLQLSPRPLECDKFQINIQTRTEHVYLSLDFGNFKRSRSN